MPRHWHTHAIESVTDRAQCSPEENEGESGEGRHAEENPPTECQAAGLLSDNGLLHRLIRQCRINLLGGLGLGCEVLGERARILPIRREGAAVHVTCEKFHMRAPGPKGPIGPGIDRTEARF